MRWVSILNLSCNDNVEFLFTHVAVVISISTLDEFLKFFFSNDLSELLGNSSEVLDGDVASAFIIKESKNFADVGSGVLIRHLLGEKIKPFLEVNSSTPIRVKIGNHLEDGSAF